MSRIFYVILLIGLFAGCVNPINKKTALNYFEKSTKTELLGDYVLAERSHERALRSFT